MAVQCRRQLHVVDGMDQVKQRHRSLCFVALQMADEVPGHDMAERLYLRCGLLDPILAQIRDAGRRGAPQALERDGLAHGHYHDLVGLARGTARRGDNACTHGCQVARELRPIRWYGWGRMRYNSHHSKCSTLEVFSYQPSAISPLDQQADG